MESRKDLVDLMEKNEIISGEWEKVNEGGRWGGSGKEEGKGIEVNYYIIELLGEGNMKIKKERKLKGGEVGENSKGDGKEGIKYVERGIRNRCGGKEETGKAECGKIFFSIINKLHCSSFAHLLSLGRLTRWSLNHPCIWRRRNSHQRIRQPSGPEQFRFLSVHLHKSSVRLLARSVLCRLHCNCHP